MVLLAVALAYPDVIAITLSNAVDSKDAAAAFGEFDKAQSLGLGLPGYDLWRSREMAILGRGLGTTSDGNLAWKKAAASASSAEISGEDRFNATFQSAVIAITFGDLSRAESKARETIAPAVRQIPFLGDRESNRAGRVPVLFSKHISPLGHGA